MEQIMTGVSAQKSFTGPVPVPGRERKAGLKERGDWELDDPLGLGPDGVAA